MFREEYEKAKNDGKLLDFFAAKTLPGKQKEDKSWLLYRYHPELIQPLAQIYSGSNLPAGYNKAELKTVLSGVVRYGEIFKEYTPYLPDKNSLK